MQSCAAVNTTIDESLVFSIASVAKPQEIKQMLEVAVKGDFIKARSLLLDVMLKYGLSGLDVIKQIQAQVWDLDLDGKRKVGLVDKCGEIEFRLVEGSDEFIQLEALLANFVLR